MDAHKSYAVAFLVGEGESELEEEVVIRIQSPSSFE
jgi:hypothetical protein